MGREREVKAEKKKMATHDVARGGKRGVTRMEMRNKRKQGMWWRETRILCRVETKAAIPEH